MDGQSDELLTPAEAALMFGVNAKTLTQWAKSGKLPHIKTLGGHRRYKKSVVQQLIDESQSPPTPPTAA